MRILLTGRDGMLARAIWKNIPADWELHAPSETELDIIDRGKIAEAIGRHRPDVIINCAAFTRVDDCESQREIAFKVNGMGPGYLAEAAGTAGSLLVHFSTDYIFDGEKGSPYAENDTPNPLSAYGASKLEGEQQIFSSGCRFLLIRTQWIYGEEGIHFVRTIRGLARSRSELRVVDDQIGSPTYASDLAAAALELIGRGGQGVYHLTNSGSCSWFDFATRIVEFDSLQLKIHPCSTAQYPRPAKRPRYSVLSNEKGAAFLGRRLRPWEEALRAYMALEPAVV